jgi:hypothetical protein
MRLRLHTTEDPTLTPHIRVRENYDAKVDGWTFHYYHPAGHAGDDNDYSYPNLPRWTFRDVITDVVHSVDRYKPVFHHELKVDCPVDRGTFLNFGGLAQITPVSGWIPISGVESWNDEVKLPLIPEGVVALAVDHAFTAMSEQVPTEINILNFTYELRELGDLIPSLAEGLSRTVSGQFLNWSFGVKPLISDLKTLGHILKTVESRLAYLRETWGKRVRVGHQEELDVELSPSTFTVQSTPDTLTSLTPIRYRCRFVASGYIYHTLDRLYGVEATLRGASAALGLLNPVEAVWNGIPFSFVVDWFGRVGNALSRLDKLQPFPGTWNCIDFGYSVSEMLQSRVLFQWPNSVPANHVIGDGIVTQKLYRRFVGLPVNPTQLIGSGSLSTSQQLLAVALLNSTRKH